MRKFSSSTSSSLFSPLPLYSPYSLFVIHLLLLFSTSSLILHVLSWYPHPGSVFHFHSLLSLLSIPPLYFILVSLFSTSPLVLFRDGISIFSRGQILFFNIPGFRLSISQIKFLNLPPHISDDLLGIDHKFSGKSSLLTHYFISSFQRDKWMKNFNFLQFLSDSFFFPKIREQMPPASTDVLCSLLPFQSLFSPRTGLGSFLDNPGIKKFHATTWSARE